MWRNEKIMLQLEWRLFFGSCRLWQCTIPQILELSVYTCSVQEESSYCICFTSLYLCSQMTKHKLQLIDQTGIQNNLPASIVCAKPSLPTVEVIQCYLISRVWTLYNLSFGTSKTHTKQFREDCVGNTSSMQAGRLNLHWITKNASLFKWQ